MKTPVKYDPSKHAVHFVADKLRDGRPIPKNGAWLEHTGAIRICETGLHASFHVSDALSFAPGATLCLVEVDQIESTQHDKLVCQRRKILSRFDATALLQADARASALSVLKNWQGEVPQVIRDWLTTGREAFRSAAESAARSAAESAARSATWSAAWSAAGSAAESAAWSATRSAARFAARSAAESAAWSAACSAARSATRSAARSAAWSAAWSAARQRLQDAVLAKFVKQGAIYL